MPYARHDALEIHYSDAGGLGTPLVLGHAFNLDSRELDGLARALAPEIRSLCVDARGFGLTRADGGPFSLWDLADDVVRVMDHAGIERAILGGHSQGGNVALRVAIRHPERVSGLVLMSTLAHADDDAVRARWREMHDVWQQHGPIPALTQGLGEAVFGSEAHARPWIERWSAMSKDSLREPLGALVGREDLTRFLPRIDVPALVVHGTADLAVPFTSGQRLAETLPRAELVRLDGVGHSPVVTHEGLVATAIRRFVAGL
jgi:pimeloyl-ACP methyl ester carboxylesterase